MEEASKPMIISRKVFISRSSESEEQGEILENLAKVIESEGHEVFYDGRKDVARSWADETRRGIETADHFLVVFTRGYIEKIKSAPGSGGKKSPNQKGDGVVWEWTYIQNRLQAAQVYNFATACFLNERDKTLAQFPLDGSAERIVVPAIPTAEAPAIRKLLERIMKHPAPRADPEPGSGKTGSAQADQEYGTIMVGDMVDFSADSRSSAERRQALHEMWQFLLDHEGLKRNNALLDSTLDGAMVVIRGAHQKESLEFAVEWIRFVEDEIPRGGGPHFGFRVGIHEGYFDKLSREGEDLPKNSNKSNERILMMFGIGPNDADRLTRIGDGGDIIVSESFVRAYREQTGKGLQDIYPEPSDRPFQAFPKPTQPQEFRVFTGHRRDRKELPLSLRERQIADTRLMSTLKEVAEVFWWLLHFDTPEREEAIKQLRKTAKLRISLFAPNPASPETELVCTEFRYLDWITGREEERKKLMSSGTRYSLVQPEVGQGHAGRAFKSGECEVIHRVAKGRAFEADLEARGLGLSTEQIRQFGRKSRTYLAIPCSFHSDKSEYLICLDLLDPLDNFTEDDLFEIAENLRQEFSELVALLMRVRK